MTQGKDITQTMPLNGVTRLSMNRFLLQSCQQRDEPDFKHPDYLRYEEMFELTESFEDDVEGIRHHLIKYPNETAETFAKRQHRLTMKNYVKRMAKGTQGMIMRKPATVLGASNKMKKLLDKIDGFRPLDDILTDLIYLATRDGKVYLLVDAPPPGVKGDPYITIILRSQVLNWRKDEDGNLTMAVIREVVAEESGLFSTQYQTQYRHFDEYGDVKLWRETNANLACATGGVEQSKGPVSASNSAAREWLIHEEYDTDYDFIPLIEIDVSDVPVLFEVAKINLRHMNRQSTLDRYLDIAALPIPLAWGVPLNSEGEHEDPKKPAMVLGVDQAIFFTGSKDEADFQWRELSGNSVELLTKDLRQLERDMLDVMERAMDESNKRAINESATASRLNNQARSALLTSISAAVEHNMVTALEYLAIMIGEKFEAELTINRDFAPILDANSAPNLLQAYVAGGISWETYIRAMQATEIIQVEDIEAEKKRVQEEAAAAFKAEQEAMVNKAPKGGEMGGSQDGELGKNPKPGNEKSKTITVDQVPTLAGVPKNMKKGQMAPKKA